MRILDDFLRRKDGSRKRERRWGGGWRSTTRFRKRNVELCRSRSLLPPLTINLSSLQWALFVFVCVFNSRSLVWVKTKRRLFVVRWIFTFLLDWDFYRGQILLCLLFLSILWRSTRLANCFLPTSSLKIRALKASPSPTVS